VAYGRKKTGHEDRERKKQRVSFFVVFILFYTIAGDIL
jgi:hypothetical protein